MQDLARHGLGLAAGCGGTSRHLLWLALIAATTAHFGCFDFTLPPQATANGTGGQVQPGAGGDNGSGGQSSDGDAGPSASGGELGLGGAMRLDAFGSGDRPSSSGGAVATGGAGNADAPLAGAGGAVSDALVDEPTRFIDGPAVEVPADRVAREVPVDAPSLPSGLVAYYSCEGASGTTLRDLSSHGNNATVQIEPATGAGGSGGIGGPPPAGYKFEPGKAGNGLTLVQAGNGYVNLPAAIFNGATEITIATWIRVTTLANWQRLFDFGTDQNATVSSTSRAYLDLVLKTSSGKLTLNGSKTGYNGEQRITADVLPTGVWKHVAAVISSAEATIYVDGVAVGSSNKLPSAAELGTITYAFVGRSPLDGEPSIDAQIDEFRVYSRALAASEIQAIVAHDGL